MGLTSTVNEIREIDYCYNTFQDTSEIKHILPFSSSSLIKSNILLSPASRSVQRALSERLPPRHSPLAPRCAASAAPEPQAAAPAASLAA